MLSPFLALPPVPAVLLYEAVDGVLMTGMRNVTENFDPLSYSSYFPAVFSALQQVQKWVWGSPCRSRDGGIGGAGKEGCTAASMVMLPECIIEIRIERMPRQADKKTTASLSLASGSNAGTWKGSLPLS